MRPAGDNLTISLVYDLSNSLNVYTSNSQGFSYPNGWGVATKQMPHFAFLGEAPKPQIFNVALTLPDNSIYPSDKWHYRLVMFTEANGGLMGLGSNSVIDPGYDINFAAPPDVCGNDIRNSVRNPDGTYHLKSMYPPTEAFMPTELPAFRAEPHTGVASVFNKSAGTPMSAPATVSYTATKVQ